MRRSKDEVEPVPKVPLPPAATVEIIDLEARPGEVLISGRRVLINGQEVLVEAIDPIVFEPIHPRSSVVKVTITLMVSELRIGGPRESEPLPQFL
jgi:hypothetical protein